MSVEREGEGGSGRGEEKEEKECRQRLVGDTGRRRGERSAPRANYTFSIYDTTTHSPIYPNTAVRPFASLTRRTDGRAENRISIKNEAYPISLPVTNEQRTNEREHRESYSFSSFLSFLLALILPPTPAQLPIRTYSWPTDQSLAHILPPSNPITHARNQQTTQIPPHSTATNPSSPRIYSPVSRLFPLVP